MVAIDTVDVVRTLDGERKNVTAGRRDNNHVVTLGKLEGLPVEARILPRAVEHNLRGVAFRYHLVKDPLEEAHHQRENAAEQASRTRRRHHRKSYVRVTRRRKEKGKEKSSIRPKLK